MRAQLFVRNEPWIRDFWALHKWQSKSTKIEKNILVTIE